MADELVKIYTTDELGAALAGVMVRAYESTGVTLITQNQSSLVGSDAIAELTIPVTSSPREIQLRMSKTGVAFDGTLGDDSKTPQKADIYSPASGAPTGKNDFTVQGQTFTRPAATDPLLCRASGFVRDMRGITRKNMDMVFYSRGEPAIAGGDILDFSPVALRTDSDGYVQLDLYRGAKLTVMLQGIVDDPRLIEVPDLPSVNIADLLFPRVGEVTFSPATLALAVGETKTVTPTVKTTDGRTLTGTAAGDVTYTIVDPTVATAGWADTELHITGVKAGSTTIIVRRVDDTIISSPTDTISHTPLTITVS